MKKILSALVLLSVLAVLVVPMVVSAQGVPECCKIKRTITIDTETCNADQIAAPPGLTPSASEPRCPFTETVCPSGGSEKWGLFCVINTINTVVDWIFIVLIALTVFFVLMGAITILTAAGAPEKISKGRDYILYAAIALVVAFIASAVPAIVKAVMGY